MPSDELGMGHYPDVMERRDRSLGYEAGYRGKPRLPDASAAWLEGYSRGVASVSGCGGVAGSAKRPGADSAVGADAEIGGGAVRGGSAKRAVAPAVDVPRRAGEVRELF